MQRSIRYTFIAAVASVAPAVWPPDDGVPGWKQAVAASHLAAQTSNAGGVTIKVTPQNLARDAKSWDFAVAFDTHSGDINDDVVKSSVLRDDAGRQYAPVAWDGPAPGGHHRAGVLRFKPVSPLPRSIELRISRPGESASRSFRWQLR